MRIIIELDDSLTVGASIEGVTQPTSAQALALRDLARLAGEWHPILTTPELRSVK